MANERKTEAFVRRHFERFQDILVEEQRSDNLKIKKLLTGASKAGPKDGSPEFIIQIKNIPDLLIIVECKASIAKHESLEHDRPADYAVDGALLYSAFLSKGYDVLAIAVSGERSEDLKISHFLQLKGMPTAIQKFGNKLLAIEDYVEGYIKSPEKFRQDYEKLLVFSKELNDKLHAHKIVESDRALLISCILIALENKAFEKTYKDYTDPRQLAEYLVSTVKNQFETAKIEGSRLQVLTSRFEFIKTDASLSRVNNVLRDLVQDIETNIKDFIKTHEYFDVLGQLYVEFLRYANSDKGLGIVLTPPHITEFMARAVEVNKNSIVYDNCTGTGGFLVSAMKIMVEDAHGDQETIRHIKRNQLIGVEYQSHIFALACSNMFIHQDGKSSILHGSCFDRSVVEQVEKYKPTVGLLNPPYKSDKKTDTEELEFVLNNLDRLEQGGRCAAIVPMSAALSKKGRPYEFKKKILEKHTLEAVFSMPDELFVNSKVGVISCVMVFTAKRPHPKNKKVFFGYFKDDGFIKRRNKGRIDERAYWEEIQARWLEAFLNKEEIAGLSVNQVVGENDEWCAEAYMETDYTQIAKKNFQDEVLKLLAYRLMRQKISEVSSESLVRSVPHLDTERWTYFSYESLFGKVQKGRETTGGNNPGEVPLISATRDNNGVSGFVLEGTKLFRKNTITVPSNGASTGEAFFQEDDYCATGDVNILIPNFEINKFRALFLITVIRLDKYRFNYGRKWGAGRMTISQIKLPTTNTGGVDWEFMENYIKSLPYSASL